MSSRDKSELRQAEVNGRGSRSKLKKKKKKGKLSRETVPEISF